MINFLLSTLFAARNFWCLRREIVSPSKLNVKAPKNTKRDSKFSISRLDRKTWPNQLEIQSKLLKARLNTSNLLFRSFPSTKTAKNTTPPLKLKTLPLRMPVNTRWRPRTSWAKAMRPSHWTLTVSTAPDANKHRWTDLKHTKMMNENHTHSKALLSWQLLISLNDLYPLEKLLNRRRESRVFSSANFERLSRLIIACALSLAWLGSIKLG